MTHPTIRQWSDYVRGVVTDAAGAAMERHLATGCESCARHVSALEGIRRVARADRRSPVPAPTVRAARDVFRIERLLAAQERAPRRLPLAFDSHLVPAAGGVRAQPGPERNLVYESPEYMVGVQLHSDPGGEDRHLTGQVLDTETGPLDGVAVFFYEAGRLRSQGASNRHGDFRLRRSAAPGRLVLLLPAGELVDVEVPGA